MFFHALHNQELALSTDKRTILKANPPLLPSPLKVALFMNGPYCRFHNTLQNALNL